MSESASWSDSPSSKIRVIKDGAHGRVDGEHYTWLCRGVGGNDVRIIQLNRYGAFCDSRVSGVHRFKKITKRALHEGGDILVGREHWPSRHLGGGHE